jgi:hypothetical protein
MFASNKLATVVYGENGGNVPRIRILGTRYKRVVSFKL